MPGHISVELDPNVRWLGDQGDPGAAPQPSFVVGAGRVFGRKRVHMATKQDLGTPARTFIARSLRVSMGLAPPIRQGLTRLHTLTIVRQRAQE